MLFGRTPAAFLILTFLTEVVMAWAIGRILAATGAVKKGLLIFLVALPMAIMPAYLTLTHPLEAMFILLALAAQAEGKRSQRLALLTACVFVKPSMAYVYGFLLIALMVLRAIRSRAFGALVKDLLPAFLTALFIFAGLTLWMGAGPVLKTILPTTGANTYAASGFGFFAASGPRILDAAAAWSDYILSSVGVFIIAAIASGAGAMWAAAFLSNRHSHASEAAPKLVAIELLFTVGVLHTTFLLAFYGWSGSWTYYSYLPVLGVQRFCSPYCRFEGIFNLSPLPRLIAILAALVLSARRRDFSGVAVETLHCRNRRSVGGFRTTRPMAANPPRYPRRRNAYHDQRLDSATPGQLPPPRRMVSRTGDSNTA